MDQQIEKIGPWSAKGSKKCHRLFDDAKFLGGRGPQDQLKVGPFDHWTIQKGSRHAVGPKARRMSRPASVPSRSVPSSSSARPSLPSFVVVGRSYLHDGSHDKNCLVLNFI